MGWDGVLSVAVVGWVIALLIFTRIASDVAMIAGVTVLMLVGILTTDQGLSGLANEGMVTVGVLYVVVAGLESTGATAWIAHHFLRRPKSLIRAQFRMMGQVAALSGFLNNTPVVAMFVPAIRDWAKMHRLSVSRFLIPLSYASILGGMCTLIGTSTNLVVNGLVIESGRSGLGMWDITRVGLPAALLGITYITLVSRWLLPERKPAIGLLSDPREYTIEMLVTPQSPLVGKTIEQAGLRHLPNMFVAEIDRDGEILAAVAPHERLQGGDRLLFVGVVDSIVELQKVRGLVPATDQVFEIDGPRARRVLVEAVVSSSCALVGKTIRDGRFRTIYNGVVIAVARNGERIRKKIGDIVLMPGDTVLVEALPGFVERQRNSRDFFLVSSVPGSTPVRHDRAPLAVGILAAMVAVVTLEWLTMLQAAMLAAGLMLATRCCGVGEARRAVDWQVLLTIAAALALGRAVEITGAAAFLAQELIALANEDPHWTLVVIYGITMLTTELITNNGAAALVFPIAMATAETLQADPLPYTIAIMLAASASFSTPIGYQTNLMVYNAGGYRFSDYLRIGLPLNLLMWLFASVLVPVIYPL